MKKEVSTQLSIARSWVTPSEARKQGHETSAMDLLYIPRYTVCGSGADCKSAASGSPGSTPGRGTKLVVSENK